MVLAGAVKVIKSETLKASGAQTEGMIRMNAITNMSDQLCGTLMVAKPRTSSAVHHHGAEDTIVYCVSGNGTVVSDNGQTRQALAPGDFALIPAFAQHQEVNDGDTDCVWVITRGGRNPIVVNLDGWGQELRRKSDASRRGSEGSTS
ncbi:putative cupin domain-containing protein [Neofusicoccum parvum UCRNP2]|uniref:Putative cupin domain-containing protein n=1 Tax=Botryosphaeria parva (strain UCR-NP2) TaxID=1287680 RepID=R1H346_BOTPV|nr:putative cupin domain-containing protein [Neofusicoccum parvum UCRNP2]